MTTILRNMKFCGNFSRYVVIKSGQAGCNFILYPQNKIIFSSMRNYAAAADTLLKNKIESLEWVYRTHGIVSKQHVNDILESKSSKKLQDIHVHLLLHSCGEVMVDAELEERRNLIKSIQIRLQEQGLQMKLYHYNAILEVQTQNNTSIKIKNFLKSMSKNNITPNRTTYELLMDYYCKKGQLHDATEILQTMKQKDYLINERIFNSLITGYSEVGDLDSAINVFNAMNDTKITPSANTYTALMCAYAKVNDIEKLKQTLAECNNENVILLSKHFIHIALAMLQNGHIRWLHDIINHINLTQSRALCPELYFMGKLLDTHEVNTARSVFREIMLRERPYFTTSYTVRYFLKKFLHSNESVEKLIATIKDLEHETKIKHLIYEIIPQFVCNEFLEPILAIMKECELKPTSLPTHFFWPLFVECKKVNDVQGAIRTITQMKVGFNINPCGTTFLHYFLPVLVKLNEHTKHNLVKECNESPTVYNNLVVYNHLLNFRIENALHYMQQHPDIYCCYTLRDVLIRAIAATYDVELFLRVLNHLYNAHPSLLDGETNSNLTHEKISISDFLYYMMKSNIPSRIALEEILMYQDEAIKFTLSPDVANEICDFFSNNLTLKLRKRIEELTDYTAHEISTDTEAETVVAQKNLDDKQGQSILSM